MLATGFIQEELISEIDQSSLSGSNRASVRAINPSDMVLLQEMHERLSKDSIYYRYLGAHKPTADNLAQLCSSNGSNGTVLVATVAEPEEKIVAVAYYQKNTEHPSKAEPAVLVEDSYQGRGVGKRILLALCQQARQMGLEAFECFTHLANDRVLRLIKGSGLHYESRYSRGVREFRVWLQQE